MKPQEFLRVAWESISRNKLRSLLTMLGIIIGVASVIIMISISAGTEATISDQITSLGSNLIYVTSSMSRGGAMAMGPGGGSSGGLVYDDAFAIEDEISSVVGVVVEQGTTDSIKSTEATLDDVEILGTTTSFPSVRDVSVGTGRFFTEEEVEKKAKVAVLGYDLAIELFGTTDVIGEVVTAGNTRLGIVGVLSEEGLKGDTDFDARLYTPVTVVFQKFIDNFFARIMGDSIRAVYVEIDPDADLDNTILQISLLLAKRHDVTLDEPDFSITTQGDIIETQESTTAAFRSLLGWVAGVSLIVGGIGIMNIMLVSVTERTREIGIRQSVGATPDDIRWQFLTESLLLSLVGGLIGVLTGIGGAFLFGVVSDMRTVIVPGAIMLAFGSAAIVGVFFGYYPANKAAQLDPIDALRHE
ncbi:MAG: ABC transporter permease [Anaerolineales bacterium]|nr:ABC transporter permease [Anaerolineales bacterium]